MTSSSRKVRWWQRYFDPQVREAIRRHKEIKAGDVQMCVVDYTDGGVAIKMPEAIRHEWDEMPYDAKQEFLRSVDEQMKDNPEPGPMLHEAIVDPHG